MGVNEISDLVESIFRDALIDVSSRLIRHNGAIIPYRQGRALMRSEILRIYLENILLMD
jgi:hypothetical protein